MKILIFGKSGQLGSALRELLQRSTHTAQFLDLPEVDLTQSARIPGYIETCTPELVINATAYTAVDKAESESEIATALNATAPRIMAEVCKKNSIPFIHYSTDYVFDGTAVEPYKENCKRSACSVYGKTKQSGEEFIENCTDRFVILRTAWLYSHVGHNFLKTMLQMANSKKTLKVVDDQIGSPTYAWDLARVSVMLIEEISNGNEQIYGTYHATNSGATSWHGFAKKIFELAGLDNVDLSPIPTSSYPTAAPRPAYSVLDCSLLEQRLAYKMPHWINALERCIDKI